MKWSSTYRVTRKDVELTDSARNYFSTGAVCKVRKHRRSILGRLRLRWIWWRIMVLNSERPKHENATARGTNRPATCILVFRPEFLATLARETDRHRSPPHHHESQRPRRQERFIGHRVSARREEAAAVGSTATLGVTPSRFPRLTHLRRQTTYAPLPQVILGRLPLFLGFVLRVPS